MTRTHTSRLEGIHCAFEIARPAERVLVIRIEGTDTGELGDAPFRDMDADLKDAPEGSIELFVDTRAGRSASIHVSSDWALWLKKHRHLWREVTMLTGSSFIRVTADFVRRFADLDDKMRLTTDRAAFDAALEQAIAPAPGTAAA